VYNKAVMIDKQSKIFFSIFLLLLVVSIIFTYYKYVVQKDFKVFTDEEAFNESLLEE